MPVRFEIIGGSGWIRIERPERLNALDAPTLDAMTDAIDACCADSGIRSIVIIGEGGRAFSTGGDLKQLRQDQIDGSPKRAEIAAERLYDRLRDCARPVVAAVDGYCLGAGFELALLSDIVVATETSQFGLSEVRFSLMPDAGLIELPRRIPANAARALLLTGQPISATRAHQLGLVAELARNRAGMLEQTESLLASLALAAPCAVAAYKQVLSAGDGVARDAARRERTKAWASLAATRDREEGLVAYLERRLPNWAGR